MEFFSQNIVRTVLPVLRGIFTVWYREKKYRGNTVVPVYRPTLKCVIVYVTHSQQCEIKNENK
jgi:hypothetical protein